MIPRKTGIRSPAATDAYRSGWDAVFGSRAQAERSIGASEIVLVERPGWTLAVPLASLRGLPDRSMRVALPNGDLVLLTYHRAN